MCVCVFENFTRSAGHDGYRNIGYMYIYIYIYTYIYLIEFEVEEDGWWMMEIWRVREREV